MGLLSDFTAYVDSLKRRGANTAREFAADPMGLLGRNVSAFSESLPAAPGEPQNEMLARPGMQDWATGVAMNAPTMGLLGHTVYHGSPHKFDKFDASKIGTGEGAQAYGHGIYVAESPEVAKSYRDALADSPDFFIGNHNVGKAKNSEIADAARFLTEYGDAGKAIEKAKALANMYPYSSKTYQQRLQRAITENAGKPIRSETPGALYKADLPDEWLPKMLDWDKPLNQQAPDVRVGLINAMRQRGLPTDDAGVPLFAARNPSAEAIHAALNPNGKPGKFDQSKAAELLKAQGIPGIRYLDQGSRGAGEGSSNYVVFPGMEHLLKILERE